MREIRALCALCLVTSIFAPTAQATVFFDNVQVATLPPAGFPGGPAMVFYDDFNMPTLDPGKWMVMSGSPQIVPGEEMSGNYLVALDGNDSLKSVTFSEILPFPNTVVVSADHVVLPSLAPGEAFTIVAGDGTMVNQFTVGLLPGIAFFGDQNGFLGAVPYPEMVVSRVSFLVTPPLEGLGLSYVKAIIQSVSITDMGPTFGPEVTIYEGLHTPFNLEWLLVTHIPEPTSALLLGAAAPLVLKRRRRVA